MPDIRYALRQLARRRAFSLTIVVTLGLGIGANALVFSVVRAVMLTPLPFHEPERLVNVWQTQPGNDRRAVAPANFLDWRTATSFEELAAYDFKRRTLGGEEPERVQIATVSANFFHVLGVGAATGRTFDAPAGEGTIREVVLRDDLWRRRFSSDPSIVGRAIRLDEESLVVVGVVRREVAFPEDVVAWTQARYDVPEVGGMASPELRRLRDARYVRVLGRLARGRSIAQAQSEMDAVAQRLREAYPLDNRDTGINIVNLQDQLTGGSRSMLWTLAGVVACILMIATANVATLMLTAAIGRRRELAIRTALGASRWRLLRELIVESCLLAGAGGAVGVILAIVCKPLLLALLPSTTPRIAAVAVDTTVALFSFSLAAATAVAVACAPALAASRAKDFTSLRDGGRSGGSKRGSRTTAILVAAQLAIAVVLMTGTGLMLRTLFTVYHRDTGIDVERLLALDVTLPDARSRGRAASALDFQRMVDRLATAPGVTAAGGIQSLPLASRGPSAGLRVEGRRFAADQAPDVSWRIVTPGYFEAAGLHAVRGRLLTSSDRDGTEPVAVVNLTLARMLWADADPLGVRIGTGLDGAGALVRIVGVVEDAPQESISAPVMPEMYRPLAQPSRYSADAMSLIVRTASDPASLTAAAREAVRQIRPDAPVSAVRPMRAVAADGVATETAVARALAMFGVLAVLLAAVGLHGITARMVADRRRELGVRIALGASPGDVRGLIVGRTLRLTAAGLVAGAAVSLPAARQLGLLLHGRGALDPLVLGGTALVLVGVAAAASIGPMRRALRIDPLLVMKSD